jgi:uncharacterized membrane protein
MDAISYTGSTRWPDLVVNRVTVVQPWQWLAKGWADMRAAAGYSLRYGAAIVLISGLLTLALIWSGHRYLVPFLAAGFFLVAPAIGLGLYQISAHLERGEPLSRCNALEALRRNQAQLSIVSAGFFIIMELWMAANFVLFALLYSGFSPPLDRFFQTVFLSAEGRSFAIASVTVGFVFAWCAFAISAVSVPMLMDRRVDGFTAVRVSIKAVLQNMPAMMLWAVLVVVIVGLALASFYVGLIIALPLIGHATWHAYRDLVPVAPPVDA